MSDLLFRGRGADIGVRAPTWKLRVAGAVLALGLMEVLSSLGVFSALGMSISTARLLFLVGGAVVAPSAIGAWLWGALVISTTVLLAVSYTPIMRPILPYFIRRDVVAAGRAADAVVVFSGSVNSDGRVMGPALDRLLTALAETKRRQVPELALSVVGDEDDPRGPDSERDQRELIQSFAPELQPRFVRNVFSSRDEALAFSALARTHGWTRVVAVTTPSHTRRACAALEHEGLVVECVPAVSRSYSPGRLQNAEERRLAFADVLYETAATVLYRFRGWI